MSDTWAQAVQCHKEGHFQKAEKLYNQVLQSAKDDQDLDSYIVVLTCLARLALDYRDDHVALQRFRKLYKQHEQMGNSKEMSQTLRHIAEIYERKDSIVEAIQMAEKSLEIAEGEWNRQQMAASYHLLGILYQKGQLDQRAVAVMREALAIWEELGNEHAWLLSSLVLADIWEEQENYSAAIRELRKSLKLYGPDDLEDVAELFFRLSSLCVRENDFEGAVVNLLACLARHRKLQSPMMERDAEGLYRLRLEMGADAFEQVLEDKLPPEGQEWLTTWLEQLYPSLKKKPIPPLTPEIPQPQNTHTSFAENTAENDFFNAPMPEHIVVSQMPNIKNKQPTTNIPMIQIEEQFSEQDGTAMGHSVEESSYTQELPYLKDIQHYNPIEPKSGAEISSMQSNSMMTDASIESDFSSELSDQFSGEQLSVEQPSEGSSVQETIEQETFEVQPPSSQIHEDYIDPEHTENSVFTSTEALSFSHHPQNTSIKFAQHFLIAFFSSLAMLWILEILLKS